MSQIRDDRSLESSLASRWVLNSSPITHLQFGHQHGREVTAIDIQYTGEEEKTLFYKHVNEK